MSRSGWWSRAALWAVALLSLASIAQAATTVVQVGIGDSFTGNIAAGVDTVNAQFNVAQGSSVRITAKAADGSTLQPTIVLRDASGAPLDIGTTMQIEWLPVAHAIRQFTAPASGNYVAEIGGSSGSGGVLVTVTGRTPDGVAMATVSGTVTNGLTGAGIAGATVRIGPYLLFADASGNFSGSLPVGDYTVTFEAAGFLVTTQSFELRTGTPGDLSVGLAPTTPVVVTASVSGDATPGGTLTAAVEVAAADGSTVESVSWTQTRGAAATLVGADTASPTVTLPALGGYKDELIHVLTEPPVGAEELPPNVPLHDEFVGGLQNRFEVVGINPFALEEAGVVVLEVTVTTTSGTYHDEVEIHVPLPWSPVPGLRNVAVGVPVLLQGKEQASYDWSLTAPSGSSASLADATSRNPEFTPDVAGVYEIDVTDQAAGAVRTLEVYAGTWRGVIVGQDADGRPMPDPGCMVCHTDDAPDKFTPWAQTGHAEIFTNNLNTSSYYRSSCFPCHTVGYVPNAANGGADDAADWQGFLDSGLMGNPGDNWTAVLDDFPATAKLANVQCENCHGPQSAAPGQDNAAHGWNGPLGDPRVDLSADVCAVCHGEPLRHARFQQWQLSPHANYELAVSRGGSGNCSRCHTANGFLEWLPILLDDDPNTDPLASVSVDWTADETHPQTCVTCHDPHDIGTTSGDNTNAKIRISGDTPPLIAGFTATGVGRGAICITCHNSRRGLHNDTNFPDIAGTSEVTRAPHGSSQGDVLMGQNAYLVSPGRRGSHSYLPDTCVTCHMEATAPPDPLSYRQSGTNHTFFASPEICSECHDNFTADTVQGGVQRLLDEVEELIEQSVLSLMASQIAAGNTIDLGQAQITNVNSVADIALGESRGRQAVTVTFTDGSSVGPVGMNGIDVVDAVGTVLGELYDFADPILPKAGWNWALFHSDGSLGVHNPFYVMEGLILARNGLRVAPAASHLPTQRSLGTSRYLDLEEIKRELRRPRRR